MAALPGSRVWFPDETRSCWTIASVVCSSSDGSQLQVRREEDNVEVVVDGTGVCLANAENVEDMTSLAFLHEPGVLWNLQSRYQSGDAIYTYTGSILIAVNPFKPLPHLYGTEVIDRYRAPPQQPGETAPPLPPHVYATACAAYRNMMRDGAGQAILVTGESGAGKTETAKLIMACLTHLGSHHSGGGGAGSSGKPRAMSGVEQKILESNPLLEAFGNAKTLRNNNSSRFGKYCEIFFDPMTGAVTGAAVRTYLLERSRVVAVNNPERSFHIFYQLVYGASAADREAWRLPATAAGFAYLARSSCVELPGQCNVEEYQHTRRAMSNIGLSAQQQCAVLRTVAAVLHLGNIVFEEGDHATVGDGAEGAVVPPGGPQAALEAAAELLGVGAGALAEALTTRQIQTPEGPITTPLPAQAAADSRDSLAKTVYARLFEWLVAAVNAAVDEAHGGSGTSTGGRQHLSIGLLDIYGFESFEVNDLEQLCINLTNEKLQQHFNQHVFKWEQAEYEREGVDWSYISFRDNADVLELLEGRLGIMTLLDEACRLPKATAEGLSNKYATCPAVSGSSRFTQLRRPATSFSVDHYAGSVTYSTANFLDKNRDYVVAEHSSLMLRSEQPLLRDLFAPEGGSGAAADSNGNGSGNGGGGGGPAKSQFQFRSVSSVCRRQLGELMGALASLQPHYVRCIKPNAVGAAGLFVAPYSLQQLRCGGVMEAVRIACAGYAYRRPYAAFLDHFWQLCPEPVHALRRRRAETHPRQQQPSGGTAAAHQHPSQQQQQPGSGGDLAAMGVAELRAAAEAVLAAAGLAAGSGAASAHHLGHTKVFLRSTAAAALERRRVAAASTAAATIQAHWRRMQVQRWFQAVRSAVVVIQARCRGLLARRLVDRIRRERAALAIQRGWRGCVERMSFLRLRRSAVTVQAAWRGLVVRRTIEAVRQERAALTLQTAWRAAAVRREYLGVLRYWRAAVKVQAAWRGYAARALYAQVLPLHRSALTCQRVWRGRHGGGSALAERLRSALLQYWHLTKAAVVVQAVWRGKAARQRCARLRLQQRRARLLAAFGGAAAAGDGQYRGLPSRPSPDSARRMDAHARTPTLSRPRGLYCGGSTAKAGGSILDGAGVGADMGTPGAVVRGDDVASLPDRDSRMRVRLAVMTDFKVSPLLQYWQAQEAAAPTPGGGRGSRPGTADGSRRGSGAAMLPLHHMSPSAAASSSCAADMPSMPGSPPDTDFREAAAAVVAGAVSCHGGGGDDASDLLSSGGLSCEPSYGQLLGTGGEHQPASVALVHA